MPALPGIDERINYVGTINVVKILPAAATFRMLACKVDRARVSFTDYGRVMRDIVLGVLCGATMGLSSLWSATSFEGSGHHLTDVNSFIDE